MHAEAQRLITYLAVLMAGLVAGLLVGTAVDHYQLRVLESTSWLAARQSIDSVFSRMMPTVWNTTLVLLAVAAYLNVGRSRGLLAAAALILLAGIIVTVAVEVPINKQIASWTPASMPAGWMDVRARWLQFHTVRTVAGVVAFACALLAL